MTVEVNEDLARRYLSIVDKGLSSGLGVQEPGKLCVEAALCYALGLPHGDNPPCVGSAVRSFKIRLNDSNWSSPEARAKGMRKLAIAQLGSDQIDQKEFARLLAEETIRVIVPIALRETAKVVKSHAEALESAAVECEQQGSRESAKKARSAAADANAAAAADANAAAAAAYAAAAAADAAAAAAYAAADAADAANAADAYAAAAAADAAYAAADAADAANAADAARDRVLSVMADLGVKVLVKLGALGCQWLGIAE